MAINITGHVGEHGKHCSYNLYEDNVKDLKDKLRSASEENFWKLQKGRILCVLNFIFFLFSLIKNTWDVKTRKLLNGKCVNIVCLSEKFKASSHARSEKKSQFLCTAFGLQWQWSPAEMELAINSFAVPWPRLWERWVMADMTLSLLIFNKTMEDDRLENQRLSRWGLFKVLSALRQIKD